MPQKPKIIQQGRISVIRDGEFVDLTADEQRTIESIEGQERSRVKAKTRNSGTRSVNKRTRNRIPRHIRLAIERIENRGP